MLSRSDELSSGPFHSASGHRAFCIVIFRFPFCISVSVLPGRRNKQAYPSKVPDVCLFVCQKLNLGKHLGTWQLVWTLQPHSFCASKMALMWEYQCSQKMCYGSASGRNQTLQDYCLTRFHFNTVKLKYGLTLDKILALWWGAVHQQPQNN